MLRCFLESICIGFDVLVLAMFGACFLWLCSSACWLDGVFVVGCVAEFLGLFDVGASFGFRPFCCLFLDDPVLVEELI